MIDRYKEKQCENNMRNALEKSKNASKNIIIIILNGMVVIEILLFFFELFFYRIMRKMPFVDNLCKKWNHFVLFNWVKNSFTDSLIDYSHIVIAVIVAIVVAMLTITITMYTFLKGNMDRSIDENKYILNVAHQFQDNCVKDLKYISIIYMIILAMLLLWHFRVVFIAVYSSTTVFAGYVVLALIMIVDSILTFQFWDECIRSRNGLSKLCNEMAVFYAKEMNAILSKRFHNGDNNETVSSRDLKRILFLIGDWDKWDTDKLDNYRLDQAFSQESPLGIKMPMPSQAYPLSIREDVEGLIYNGKRICEELTRDQFLNLFSRTEELLLNSSNRKTNDQLDENEIVTIIQERQYIFDAMTSKKNGIEYEDLRNLKYKPIKEKQVSVSEYIEYFRRRVGFTDRKEQPRREFYDEMESMYKCLLNYRNIKISLRHYSKEDNGISSEDSSIDFIMAVGIYYFFFRVLCVFSSSVYISDFTFNSATLNFADFYSSNFENVSMFGSLFYHTILARTKWNKGTLDLSAFNNVFFYNTQFNETSLNNCLFEKCIVEDSVFENVSLNNCAYKNCEIDGSDFTKAKLSTIKWEQSEVKNTSFENADIKNWEWNAIPDTNGFIKWTNNSYSGALIEEVSWKLMDLTNSVFVDSSIVATNIIDCKLNGSIFDKANMANATITNCRESIQCSFRSANLYNADITNCKFIESNFYYVSAMEASIRYCDFNSSDCSEMNLRKADLFKNKFDYARLYQTTFNTAKVISCRFNNVLGDGLQFTYVKCNDSDFSGASMGESNYSGTIFKECEFDGSGMNDSVYYETVFEKSRLNHTDFSNSRFVDARFLNCSEFRFCDLSSCSFERTKFENINFNGCVINRKRFSECKFINVSFEDCIGTDELLADIGSNEIIKNL